VLVLKAAMSKRVLTIISIIIGACGILYGGINAFVKDPGKLPILGSFLGNPGDITLLLLGLLLVIVGVQNLDLLSDMNEGVERIEDIAKQVLSRLAVNPEPIVLEGGLKYTIVPASWFGMPPDTFVPSPSARSITWILLRTGWR
jgi:uncharacterized membrane protein YvlD (DUF360 family)